MCVGLMLRENVGCVLGWRGEKKENQSCIIMVQMPQQPKAVMHFEKKKKKVKSKHILSMFKHHVGLGRWGEGRGVGGLG